MLQKSGSRRFLVFLFAILLLAGLGSCKRPPAKPDVRNSNDVPVVKTHSESGVDFIFDAHRKLRDNYAEPDELKHAKLFNSALDKAAAFLKEKKIEFVPKKIVENSSLSEAKKEFADEFNRALKLAEKSKDIKDNELTFTATAAMLQAVDDSHTYFIPPEEYQEYLKRRRGEPSYCGIGGGIRKLEEGFFYFERVYEDCPAQKAGLKRFDRIVAVGDKKEFKNVKDIVDLVRGQKDTEVEITVERNGLPLTAKVKRDDIKSPSGTSRILKDDKNSYGHLTLYSFSFLETEIDIIQGLDEVKKAKARGIIVDLRGNPGGNLLALNFAMENFLKAGTTAITLKGKNSTRIFKTSSNPTTDLPLVILIDQESASAAEVFAAVMQEQGRATVVGKKSGGFVNAGISLNLPEGAGMMVTIEKIVTAKGKVLEKNGVTPDVSVEITKNDIIKGKDAQLDKALEILKEKTADEKK